VIVGALYTDVSNRLAEDYELLQLCVTWIGVQHEEVHAGRKLLEW
jgi:hypothetical protein